MERICKTTLKKLGLIAVILSASLFSITNPAISEKTSLFDRLGGIEAIKSVVDQFVSNCAGDKRINFFFSGVASDTTRMAKFKAHLVNQVCDASGGKCKYEGRTMKDTHNGMNITNAHFDALVENLVQALDKFNVQKS